MFKDYKKFFPKEEKNLFVTTAEEVEKIIKTKKTQICIYDLTHVPQAKNQEIFFVNNHINKSGTNPFLLQTRKKIKFHDITEIYLQHPKGKTTICLGKRYNKEKENHHYPSSCLAHVAIELATKGYKNIQGKLINNFDSKLQS